MKKKQRQIQALEEVRVLQISHSTVLLYLNKARKKDLTWDIVQTLDDAFLRSTLLTEEKFISISTSAKPLPDFATITQELRIELVRCSKLMDT